MSAFSDGFVRGFSNTLATDIQTRRAEARDYFNKQVEVARTTGVQNRQRVRQAVDSSVNIARQLSQMGVPKETVMAVANQNPDGLGDFYKQVAGLEEKGATINKELFDSILTVGGDFQAPDEDFQSFFSRMYEPVAAAVSSDPEAFNSDKKGSIFAAMMGLNAMDSARERLGKTEVSDGLTAQQLLDYGDSTTPNKVGGDAVVTFNFDKMGEINNSGKELTAPALASLSSTIGEEFGAALGVIESDPNNVGEDPTAGPRNKKSAGISTFKLLVSGPYGKIASPSDILDLVNMQIRKSGGTELITEEDLVAAPEEPMAAPTDGLPPPEGGDVPPPTDNTVADTPIDPKKEPRLKTLIDTTKGLYLTFTIDNGDGTSTYLSQDGEEFIIPNTTAREYVNK